MKGIIKLFPAALAVFALASCSNEDFFGSDVKQTQKLVTTFEDTNSEDATRAAWVNNGGKTIDAIWQEGDLFRVYDAALQKYDEYECNGTDIRLKGTAATTHAKAIFPGNQVFYAGYDKANDDVVAVMEIPSSQSFNAGATAMVENAGKVGYVSLLPQWGDTKNETEDKLEVGLNWLTGIAKVTVYKGGADKIRIVAAASDAVAVQAAINAAANNAALAGLAAGNLDTTTPLAGYFEAQLKTDGVLKTTKNALVADTKKATSYIEVDLTNNGADSIHVYLPIIPATYKYLKIQKHVGGAWTDIKAYKNQKINRGTLVMNGLTCGEAPIDAEASSLEELNDLLKTIKSNYPGKPVNIELTGEGNSVATIDDADAAKQTLTIPAFTTDQILSIKGSIKNVAGNRPLKIVMEAFATDPATTQNVTLNLNVEGTENVEITNNNAKNTLQLTGSIASSGTNVAEHGTIKVAGANPVVLGNSEFGSFTTTMPIAVSGTAAVTIDAGDGSIGNLTTTVAAASGDITVNSGTVAAITTNGGNAVTVNDGKVTSITNKVATGNIVVAGGEVTTITADKAASTFTSTISGGKVTTLNVEKSTGAVDVKNAEVTTLTTGSQTVIIEVDGTAPAVAADTYVGTLNMKNAADAANVTLTGGDGANGKTAKIGDYVDNDSKTVTVTSTGKAAILKGSKIAKTTFSSTWSDAKNAAAAADMATDGNIYTASQLAGIQAGKNYTLKANITATGVDWTPVNLSGNFTADSKTITGLNAPLFGTVTSGVIGGKADNDDPASEGLTKALVLTGVNINSDAADLGAIAKVVSGNVTIQYVSVAGTIGKAAGKNTTKNIGGLIGRVTTGTVKLFNNKVAATVQGYANVGGFIGNVAGGDIQIQTNQTGAVTTFQSSVTFGQSFLTATPVVDVNAGTFGNIIGSITSTNATVVVGTSDNTKATYGNAAALFFENTTNGIDGTRFTALHCDYNKNAADKAFKGMQGIVNSQALSYEIGYSPITSLKKLTLYNKTKNDLNKDYTLTIDNINQYQP